MKKTQRIDTLRNIKKNILSWISILFIAGAAVMAYLGITFAAQGMRRNGNDFYTETKFRDLEIASTLMLSGEDIEAIKAVSGVRDIEGLYFANGKLRYGGSQEGISVSSLTERINVPLVRSGTLPVNSGECAVEQTVAEKLGIKLGDTVKLTDDTSDSPAGNLNKTEFKVTALVLDADHIAKSEQTPGRRYVYVPRIDFNEKDMEGNYMKVEVLVEGTEGLDRFGSEYLDKVDEVKKRIAEIGSVRAQEKYNELKTRLNEALAELRVQIKKEEEQAKNMSDDDPETKQELLKICETSRAALDETERELAKLKDGNWFIYGVTGNPGYVHLSSGAESVSSLSFTFALFFIVIAALVIYTSVGRIMEEQRKLIGAAKALGLFNREILAKYMVFALSAVLIGTLLGTLAGYFLIQQVVLKSYNMMYVLGSLTPAFNFPLTVIMISGALLLAAAAVWLSCSKLMKSTAIQLMQEKQPAGGKKKGRSGGRLYARLIFRNMRSDLSRVLITTVSVAGCCALLVVGFTMRSSANGIIPNQFGKIEKFDRKLTYSKDSEEESNSEAEFERILNSYGAEWVKLNDEYRLYSDNDDIGSAEVFCGDLNEINRLFGLIDPDTGKALDLRDDGVYIQSRTAETTGMRAGDKFVIYNKFMCPCEVRVAGVFTNYIGYNMVVSEKYYSEIFDESPEYNTYLINSKGADGKAMTAELGKVEGYKGMKEVSKDKNRVEKVVLIFTGIAGIMVLAAGLMAYFILLNINKMYITQKTRELSIMRINGFTVGEVKKYILMETVVTTAAGILIGLTAGSVMGYVVIRFIETSYVQFVRSVSFVSWGLAVAITVFFTFGINAIALRKIKHLKLTDVA